MSSGGVRLYVRMTQRNQVDNGLESDRVVQVTANQITVRPPGKSDPPIKFPCDRCFQSVGGGTGEDPFQVIGEEISNNITQGLDTCIFTLGQTTSGNPPSPSETQEQEDLVSLICSHLFSRETINCTSYRVKVSFTQINNGDVRDLLAPGGMERTFQWSQWEDLVTCLDGLSQHVVRGYQDIKDLIGGKDETYIYSETSNSYNVFTIILPSTTGGHCTRVILVNVKDTQRITGEVEDAHKEGNSDCASNTGPVISSYDEPDMKMEVTDSERISGQPTVEESDMEEDCNETPPRAQCEDTGCGGNTSGIHTAEKSNENKSSNIVPPAGSPANYNTELIQLFTHVFPNGCNIIILATISQAAEYYQETISTLSTASSTKKLCMEMTKDTSDGCTKQENCNENISDSKPMSSHHSGSQTAKKENPSNLKQIFQEQHVGIFSRSAVSNYQWLQTSLTSQFQGRFSRLRVEPFYISNNGWRQFAENVSWCNFAILYHTKKRGRINITDVTDSLYEDELKYLSSRLGKEKVWVVVDDLEDSSSEQKIRILSAQHSIGRYARDLVLTTQRDKEEKSRLIGQCILQATRFNLAFLNDTSQTTEHKDKTKDHPVRGTESSIAIPERKYTEKPSYQQDHPTSRTQQTDFARTAGVMQYGKLLFSKGKNIYEEFKGSAKKRQTVGIFSRTSASDYDWLETLLRSHLSDVVQDIKHYYIYNNRRGQFYDEVSQCTFAILYHTKNRGRINVTDVSGSLYDEELEYLSKTLGKDKVIIVVGDMEESSSQTKERILQDQPSIRKWATDLILFKADERHLSGENAQRISKNLQIIRKSMDQS